MANIKKCDICGKIYNGRKLEFISDVASSRVTVSDYGDYSDKYDHTYDGYDTCPVCTAYIKRIINTMRLKATTYPDLILPSAEAENPCDCRRCRKRRKEAAR